MTKINTGKNKRGREMTEAYFQKYHWSDNTDGKQSEREKV